jgi:hypothetical protein
MVLVNHSDCQGIKVGNAVSANIDPRIRNRALVAGSGRYVDHAEAMRNFDSIASISRLSVSQRLEWEASENVEYIIGLGRQVVPSLSRKYNQRPTPNNQSFPTATYADNISIRGPCVLRWCQASECFKPITENQHEL